MVKSVYKVIVTLLTGIMVLTASGCGENPNSQLLGEEAPLTSNAESSPNSQVSSDTDSKEKNAQSEQESSEMAGEKKEQYPQVTIEMDDGEKIVVELYPEYAPNTVNNFISLVNKGFYDGVVFHRIIEGFMIQGGDPTGTGMGGPGYGIDGEFAENGFKKNTLKHERGVISMARAQDPNSAGSQFFIMHDDAPFLDDKYAPFGKVISGIEVVDKIVAGPKTGPQGDLAKEPRAMKKVTVDTFDVKYPEPKTNNNR